MHCFGFPCRLLVINCHACQHHQYLSILKRLLHSCQGNLIHIFLFCMIPGKVDLFLSFYSFCFLSWPFFKQGPLLWTLFHLWFQIAALEFDGSHFLFAPLKSIARLAVSYYVHFGFAFTFPGTFHVLWEAWSRAMYIYIKRIPV